MPFRQPPPAAAAPIPAATWRRLVAFAIDGAVLTPLLVLATWVWVELFEVALPSSTLPLYDYLVQLHLQGDPLVMGGVLFLMVLTGAYFLIAHLLWSTTVGMHSLGLVVVDSRGEIPGAGTCAARILGAGLSAAYFLLGFVWIAFDGRRQGLHDKIADTLVIQRKTR